MGRFFRVLAGRDNLRRTADEVSLRDVIDDNRAANDTLIAAIQTVIADRNRLARVNKRLLAETEPCDIPQCTRRKRPSAVHY